MFWWKYQSSASTIASSLEHKNVTFAAVCFTIRDVNKKVRSSLGPFP